LRFDALARYLQDVSNDDTRDARLDDDMAWVVRRTVLVAEQFPVFGEELDLVTFCGGLGGRWAERRVSIAGDLGGRVEAATLWVHLDVATSKPKPLSAQFVSLFGEAASGRTVRARLHHSNPPVSPGPLKPWPTRAVDFDLLGHVNNAAYWAIAENEMARRGDLVAPLVAEIEFRNQVGPDDVVSVVGADAPGQVEWWLTGTDVFASGVLRTIAEVGRPGEHRPGEHGPGTVQA
jgi:acyl-ACP thioesterase